MLAGKAEEIISASGLLVCFHFGVGYVEIMEPENPLADVQQPFRYPFSTRDMLPQIHDFLVHNTLADAPVHRIVMLTYGMLWVNVKTSRNVILLVICLVYNAVRC